MDKKLYIANSDSTFLKNKVYYHYMECLGVIFKLDNNNNLGYYLNKLNINQLELCIVCNNILDDFKLVNQIL